MADVLFKRGSQTDLDALRVNSDKTKRIPGAFYLTEDSHRLYVGINNDNNDIVPVNEGITTVETLNQLPNPSTADDKKLTTGQFYYVYKDNSGNALNVLAIYNGQEWIQINSNTDTTISSFTQTVSVSSGTATIKGDIKDSSGTTKSSNFKITVAGGLTLSVNTAKDTLTIDASALQQDLGHTVDTSGVDITLLHPKTTGNKFRIEAGNFTTIEANSDNTGIKINSADHRVKSVAIGNGNAAGNSTNGFNIKVTDNSSNSKSANFDPTIKLANDTDARHFTGGNITLPVYTTTEIDDKFKSELKAIDGMTYKGTIGTNGTGHNGNALPTTNVRIGDTYKTLSTFTVAIGGVTPSEGDVIIARSTDGTENANGYIDSAKITWDLIPSGNEDTTYYGVSATHGIGLKDSSNATVMAFTLESGNASITLEDTTGDKSNKVKITHAAPTAQTKTAETITGVKGSGDHVQNTLTGTVIKDVLKDSTGHVAGLQQANISFSDTNATLVSAGDTTVAAASLGSSSSKVSLKTTLKQSSGTTKTSTSVFTVYSDNKNLQVSADATNDAVKVSFVWDSF
jgi:hypothetical protein